MQLVVIALLAAGSLPAGETPGVGHFHQVDEHVYRGGVPSKRGFETLQQLGVRTVVDLLPGEERARKEQLRVEALGMRYVNIPMSAIGAPSADQMSKALAVLESAPERPVFIHCRLGKDRTGTVVACYRIAHDHWRNQQALDEAKSFGLNRVEKAMRRYILQFEASAVATR